MPNLHCRHLELCVLTTSIVLAFIATTLADESGQLSETQRKERLRRIRSIVQPFDVTVVTPQEANRSRLLDEPSLLYADNAREVSDSSMWVWEFSGRPVSALAIEFHPVPQGAAYWTFEFVGLSPQQLRISLAPDRPWTTDPGAAMLRTVANAPAVAETRVLRAQQMKRLADRFAAVEIHRTQGRIALRRLSTPVYRQAETAAGDGAIFVFAHGTNPEVVLSIGTSSTDPPVWNYALGALAAEELYATFDGQEVWREGLFTKPGVRPTYINGRQTPAVE